MGIKLGSTVRRFTIIYEETLINRLVNPQHVAVKNEICKIYYFLKHISQNTKVRPSSGHSLAPDRATSRASYKLSDRGFMYPAAVSWATCIGASELFQRHAVSARVKQRRHLKSKSQGPNRIRIAIMKPSKASKKCTARKKTRNRISSMIKTSIFPCCQQPPRATPPAGLATVAAAHWARWC